MEDDQSREVSPNGEKLKEFFLQACEKKLWENAALFLKKIAKESLNIDLAFLSEATSQPDAKITKLLEMLTHLDVSRWTDNQNNKDFIVKAKDTLTKSLEETVTLEKEVSRQTAIKTSARKSANGLRVPKSAPPKPAVVLDLVQQRALFDQAARDGALGTATDCLEAIGRCLNVSVFSPSDQVELSDTNIRDLFTRLNTLAIMSFDDDQKLNIFLSLEEWWNKFKEKTASDWRTYISVRGEMSNIYFERDQDKECVAAVESVLAAHENIKHEESEGDIEYLMGLCCDAAKCCASMNDAAEEKKWSQRAEHYRLILVKQNKEDLQKLLATCNEDAVAILIRLRKFVESYALPKDKALESYVDEQTYIFALKLYNVFKACREKGDLEEAERVIGQVKRLVRRMVKRSDEAELLRIECGVQLRAFDISFESNCSMQKAIELARTEMPAEDKKKKEEIDARKKHAQAISGFKGSFRGFRKLDLNSESVKLLVERRACVQKEMEESTCDTVVNACQQLIAACDVIHKCWSDIQGCEEADFLDLPSDELLARTQELDRARKSYESREQLEEALKTSKEALPKGELKPLTVIEVPEVSVGTISTFRRFFLFPKKFFIKPEFSPTLINRCEVLLNDLVRARRSSESKLFVKTEIELSGICEELFERYPGFQDILDDESHDLYGVMSILQSCRKNCGTVKRVPNTMPNPQQIKEMCGKLLDRIEKVERLRRASSL